MIISETQQCCLGSCFSSRSSWTANRITPTTRLSLIICPPEGDIPFCWTSPNSAAWLRRFCMSSQCCVYSGLVSLGTDLFRASLASCPPLRLPCSPIGRCRTSRTEPDWSHGPSHPNQPASDSIRAWPRDNWLTMTRTEADHVPLWSQLPHVHMMWWPAGENLNSEVLNLVLWLYSDSSEPSETFDLLQHYQSLLQYVSPKFCLSVCLFVCVLCVLYTHLTRWIREDWMCVMCYPLSH